MTSEIMFEIGREQPVAAKEAALLQRVVNASVGRRVGRRSPLCDY